MGSKKKPGDWSFFETALRSFLRRYHPEVKDEGFIRIRSDAALDSYLDAIGAGANRLEASEIANAVLFEGLRFSNYEALHTIISEWFDEVPDEMKNSFTLKLYPLCTPIFDDYDTTGDDFELSEHYPQLRYELTGFVQTYIERYGI